MVGKTGFNLTSVATHLKGWGKLSPLVPTSLCSDSVKGLQKK